MKNMACERERVHLSELTTVFDSRIRKEKSTVGSNTMKQSNTFMFL